MNTPTLLWLPIGKEPGYNYVADWSPCGEFHLEKSFLTGLWDAQLVCDALDDLNEECWLATKVSLESAKDACERFIGDGEAACLAFESSYQFN